MKVKKSVYLVDKFVDYTGTERPVTMCASSIECDVKDGIVIADFRNTDCIEDAEGCRVTKILSLGIAVGHINDKNCWNEEIGKKIALGRSLKWNIGSPILVTSYKGFISTELVDAFLKKEMEHFKKDPGTYITGYNDSKERYLKKCQTEQKQD